MTFDLETGMRVASKVTNLSSKLVTAFGFPNYSLCRLRDGRTDGRTYGRTNATLTVPFTTGEGIINSETNKTEVISEKKTSVHKMNYNVQTRNQYASPPRQCSIPANARALSSADIRTNTYVYKKDKRINELT